MPSVELYYMAESPPCRAVEMAANMAGVTLNKHYVNLFTKEHLNEENLKVNPLHKIPFMIDGDLKINESCAIIAYLANRYMPADNTLYPKDPVERARIDELLFIDASLLHPSTKLLFTPLLFGTAKDYDPEAEKAYRDNLRYIDNRLKAGGHKFLLGDNLTIADISIVSVLTFPVLLGYDISEFKHLTAYIENLKTSIPKYQEINDEAMESCKKFVEANRAKLAAQI